MEILRCQLKDRKIVLDAIKNVKAEEDCNEVSDKAIERFLKNPDAFFLAAVEDGKAVGYSIAYRQNRLDSLRDMMCFYEIGVLREYRCRGIGTCLIEELKRICREEKIKKMWVPTNRSNAPACALYEKTGGMASAEGDEVTYTYPFCY